MTDRVIGGGGGRGWKSVFTAKERTGFPGRSFANQALSSQSIALVFLA
jgi:hypothetical protein